MCSLEKRFVLIYALLHCNAQNIDCVVYPYSIDGQKFRMFSSFFNILENFLDLGVIPVEIFTEFKLKTIEPVKLDERRNISLLLFNVKEPFNV